MEALEVRDEGAQKYVLVEWLARTRMNPNLKGKPEPLLDLEKTPKDLMELAQLLGVAPQKLTKWVSSKQIQDATAQRIRQISSGYLATNIEDVNRELVRQALAGTLRAIELFYSRVDKELYAPSDQLVGDSESGRHNPQINIMIKQIIERNLKPTEDKWEDVEEGEWIEI